MLPVAFGTQPAWNLSASDPASVFAAQGVNLALARANASGALPPLQELTALLTANSPAASILATLPAPASATPFTTAATPEDSASGIPDATSPVVSNPVLAPSFLLNAPNQLRSERNGMGAAAMDGGDDRAAAKALNDAQTALTVAQLTNAFYILETIGDQLLADAALLALKGNASVAAALEFAGFQCASLGFALATAASEENTAAAQRTITYLQDTASLQKAQAASLAAQASSSADGSVDPDLIYGTWQRLENQGSGQLILYKVTRNEFVKINVTTDANGDEDVEIEAHPGAVTAYISYKRPGGGGSPEKVIGRINLKLVVGKADGSRLALTFAVLQAKGSDGGENAGRTVEVLVEQEGERKAFVRVSDV